MHTKITAETNKYAGAYTDLRNAILSHAFVERTKNQPIIASEHTGANDSWLFDFRALILQPEWLDRYAEIFWEQYAHKLPFQVGGVETAGIPLVAAIVMKSVQRGTPVNGFYIRKSRKRQGLMKFIEGTLTDEPVIFVDDLMNTGRSVKKQIDILSEEGKKVADVFVMLTYRADDAYAFLREQEISLTRLFTLADFGIPLLSSQSPVIPSDVFTIKWHYAAPTPSLHIVLQKSAPVVDDNLVFFGCDDGVFRALDQTTGTLAWEFSVGRHSQGKSILSSPTLHDNVVYFGAYDGTFYALDARTGKKVWAYSDADWIGSSPCIAPERGLVYIGLEFGLFRRQGGIAALDIKTGNLVWSAPHPSLTHASPLYISEESLVVIGSNNGVLYAYDAQSGKQRWSFQTEGEIKTRAAYDPAERTIIFGSMDGTVYALFAHDGTPLFARETGAGMYSIPLVHKDKVYIASLDKCLYAIDTRSGKDRWIFETSGRIFASPIIANNSLWIGSNDGRLYELDLETGKLKRFFQTTERIVNAIATNDNLLFIPTVANELYCVSLIHNISSA